MFAQCASGSKRGRDADFWRWRAIGSVFSVHWLGIFPDQSLSFLFRPYFSISTISLYPLSLHLTMYLSSSFSWFSWCMSFSVIALPLAWWRVSGKELEIYCFPFPFFAFSFPHVVRRVKQHQICHNYYNGVTCIKIFSICNFGPCWNTNVAFGGPLS